MVLSIQNPKRPLFLLLIAKIAEFIVLYASNIEVDLMIGCVPGQCGVVLGGGVVHHLRPTLERA